jgi:glutathione reductase (NADPH)
VRQFDLLVIGGGSGGLAAAQRAVEYGARVALFEPGRLGGTCVNVGCVPKKVMWNAAELAAAVKNAPYYGFDVRASGHDWPKLKRGRDAYVLRLNDIYERNLDRKGIVTVRAAARLRSATEVFDANGEVYQAKHIVIATGGLPKIPPVPGAGLGITSDGFFELEQLPRRVAVVGSGYIAVELAGVLRALGSEVTLCIRHDALLRHFDALLGEKLVASMRASGVDVVTTMNTRADRARSRKGRFQGCNCGRRSCGSAPSDRAP